MMVGIDGWLSNILLLEDREDYWDEVLSNLELPDYGRK